MARPTTYKTVQVHEECSCGRNDVFPVKWLIRFKDLKANGIRYKKSSDTGKYYFEKYTRLTKCNGHDEQY